MQSLVSLCALQTINACTFPIIGFLLSRRTEMCTAFDKVKQINSVVIEIKIAEA